MKRLMIHLVLASLIALIFSACTQTATAPESQTSPEAAQLLARSLGDANMRQYLAEQLQPADSDSFPGLSTEQLHSNEFYQVMVNALGGGQSLADIEAAFDALPHAYLVAPLHFDTWKANEESALVAFLAEDQDVGDTVTAFDARLSPHELSAEQEPREMVLVLHEGFDVEAARNEIVNPQTLSCTEPSHRGRFETRTFTIVDVRGRRAGIAKREATPGWVIHDANISVSKKGASGASHSLVNAGSSFITLQELKQVRDTNFKFSASLGDDKVKADLAIKNTYELFIKYTTEKVTEQTLVVDWYVGRTWFLGGAKLKVIVTMKEMCNNVDAVSKPKTDAAFKRAIAKTTGVVQNGKITFRVYPSNIYAYLTVKGNGRTYSANPNSTLTLPPGTYTVSGEGYDYNTGDHYIASESRISVAAGQNRSHTVYMYQDYR